MQEVSTDITYQLPYWSSSKFSKFFEKLDSQKEKLGISSYGVSLTTLEEVFLKIGHGTEANLQAYKMTNRQKAVKFISFVFYAL